jgi:membrane associated rhomboid family serine protease
MSSFSISVGITILVFAAVVGVRWYRSPRKSKGLGAIQYMVELPPLVTLVFLIFTFGTVWLFYIKDGIEGAKVAWNFGGPIIGAAAGYWFGRPHRNE